MHLKLHSHKPPKKTYFVASSFDHAPGGALSLGRILTNPLDPSTCINVNASLRAVLAPVRRTSQTNWQDERKRIVSGATGVWAEFLKFVLSPLGIAEVSLRWDFENRTVYKFDVLETESVDPTREFVVDCVMDPVVAEYVARTGYRKPIYMITGIKIARGAAVRQMASWKVSGQVKAGVDVGLAVAGVPAVTTGPQLGLARGSEKKSSFSGGSDFVFAYQVREVYYQKRQKKWRDAPYIKGALYDLDLYPPQEAHATAEETVSVLSVGEMADEVETVDSLGLGTIDVLDECCQGEGDGEVCAIVLPPVNQWNNGQLGHDI